VFHHDASRVGLDEYDVANQGLISHHYANREGTLLTPIFH